MGKPTKDPLWISSLYFAEGAPAAIVCEVAVMIFADLGADATAVARDVSILGMPWMLKPLWAPVVDCFGSKKRWIIAMQLAMSMLFALSGFFAAPAGRGWFFALLMAAAFASATHDIAADGFYIVALDDHAQSLYSGLRSVFFRAAMIVANGGMLYFAARAGECFGLTQWQQALLLAAVLFYILAVIHLFLLPAERPRKSAASPTLRATLKEFCRIPHLWVFVLFLIFFRFAEAQLSIVAKLFLRDPEGGAMTLERYSLFVGTLGVAAMLAGGIVGGVFAARVGLKRALVPMVLALNVPDALYAWWAFFPVSAPAGQAAFIAVEQFGYGFGFTGYMLVMIYLAGRCGSFQTTVFSYLTCLMILGLRLPGMFSGALLKNLNRICGISSWSNYRSFFLWVLVSTLVSFAVTLAARRHIPGDFGIAAKDDN